MGTGSRSARSCLRHGRSLVGACSPLVLAAVAVAGCDQGPRPLPPPPENARPFAGAGAPQQRLDLVVADVRRRLAAEGPAALSVRSFSVPRATEWDALVEHYSRDLGAGWKPAADVPPSAFAYRFAAWRQPGKIFTIAFVETPDPEHPVDFRILVETTSAR
jgi:hypothetical protein